MIEGFNTLRRLLQERSHSERAHICAYLLAPMLILGLAIAGSHGNGLIFDLVGPVTVSELHSEVSAGGETLPRRGVALIIEPSSGELRIPIIGQTGKMWSSLDEATMKANRGRLTMSNGAIESHTPMLGVSAPITLIIEGELGKEVQLPGRTDSIDEWRLSSRRSLSILSSVLVACVFAFGIALATSVPTLGPNQKTGSEVGA